MADINLTQAEANALFRMKKNRVNDRVSTFPLRGQKERIELISVDKREKFWLDMYRGRKNVLKVNLQNRGRQTVPLVRLDLNGKHTNPGPDGEVFDTTHLHVYREGLGCRWAVPIPTDRFSNLNDIWTTLQEFMLYCNITRPPCIRRDLFT